MPKVKTIKVNSPDAAKLQAFPNFSSSGSIAGMKKLYYGKDALLVRCGSYIYNVSSAPDIYNNA